MTKRYCEVCYKSKPACVCAWISPQENSLPIIILQHPDEQAKPLGSARIAELSLDRVTRVVGTRFSPRQYQDILKSNGVNRPVLLYPQHHINSVPHTDLDFEKENLNESDLLLGFDSVILLDGTWRNTRELLLSNNWLTELPTMALKNAGQSQYLIRKAQKQGALATIEAVSKLLSVVNNCFEEARLLLPFEKMIEYQISRMGQAVYQKNYIEKAQSGKREE